jgi:DNA-binding response OmpR family regulator
MKKILVADDDPGICTVVKLTFDKQYKVVTVYDGDQALDELRKDNTYSCVLLDVQMPRMNGMTVFKSMKETPSLKNIPVVILTGNDDLQIQVQALTQGVTTYFHKPFAPSQLQAMVANIVNNAM